MSEAQKLRYADPAERAKHSRKKSQEEKDKIAATMRGRKRSDAARKAISDGHKGKIVSEETRRRISDTHKARKRVSEDK